MMFWFIQILNRLVVGGSLTSTGNSLQRTYGWGSEGYAVCSLKDQHGPESSMREVLLIQCYHLESYKVDCPLQGVPGVPCVPSVPTFPASPSSLPRSRSFSSFPASCVLLVPGVPCFPGVSGVPCSSWRGQCTLQNPIMGLLELGKVS